METLESAPVLMAETAAEIGGGGEGLVVDLSVSVVPASENASSQQPFNPGEFEFNRRLLLNVLAYSVMCVVGAIGNAIVFVAAYRQHVSPENQHGRRNNVHIMVVHLTIADLMVSFVVMPLEIGWRLSVQWVAGNAACKALMFIRAFAFYLSSATLVCLSLDRYLAIAQPMATLKMNVTRRRGRIMIMLAWLAAGVFALPQTFVFRVLKHPKIEFYQCTSMGFFSELMGIAPGQQQQLNSSEILSNSTTTASTFVGNITEEDFLVNDTLITDEDDNLNGTSPSRPPSATVLGLGPEDLERVYSSIFLVAVYMVPLLVIVVTYANILAKIIRKRKASSSDGGEENQGGGRETRSSGGGGHRGSTANGLFGYSFKSTTGGGSSARRHLHRPRHNSGSGGSAHSSTHDGGGGSVHLGASTGSATASNYAVNNSSLICRNRQMRFARSQTVALRMSTTHVLAFVGCWTPYLVISAWHIVDPEGVGKDVSPEVQDALFLTAVFNSCINPLVYGGFYFRALRKSRRRQKQREQQQREQIYLHQQQQQQQHLHSGYNSHDVLSWRRSLRRRSHLAMLDPSDVRGSSSVVVVGSAGGGGTGGGGSVGGSERDVGGDFLGRASDVRASSTTSFSSCGRSRNNNSNEAPPSSALAAETSFRRP